mgnify:CR=1 FL=1
MYLFFFFQAEDGIRDLVRSRGLGDVYKRQKYSVDPGVEFKENPVDFKMTSDDFFQKITNGTIPVSYTHLTLPTSDLV